MEFDGGFQHGNAGQTHQALKGKKLIVMGSNMGGDVHATQFDVLIPGGGVGQFDSFSGQIGNNNLGERYGGLLAACGNPPNLSEAQTCLRTRCNSVFGATGQDWLKAGCNFYADWFMAANNPTMTFKTVTCPQVLKDRYQKAATGSPGGGVVTTKYTLTINRSPTAGGTVTGAGEHIAGAPVEIKATPATGYAFNGWTISSGTATFGNASNSTTTVTLNSNATIVANFVQTFTLTVSAGAGGTVSPSGAQANITAGTVRNISATANSGYTFSGWTVTVGTATIANPNSASTSVPVNGNITVTANFTLIPTQPTTYTLTINRNTTAGGTVTPTSGGSHNASTPISISATPASGYTFSNWTAGSGASIANANSATTTVTLTGNATITANFTQTAATECNLTINRSPTTGGTVTGSGTITAGNAKTITASPASGYTFSGWTITSSNASINNVSNASTSVTVTASTASACTGNNSVVITANFQQQGNTNCLVLTKEVMPEGSGDINVTPDKTCYTQADAIKITAVPKDGWEFSEWAGDGTYSGAPAELTINMSGHNTITAYFKQIGIIEGGPAAGMRNEVTRIEAEKYDTKVGDFIIAPSSSVPGLIGIGEIGNGNRATYNFTALKATAADTSDLITLRFHIASLDPVSFIVVVNGVQTGRISYEGTGSWSWSSGKVVTLTEDAKLKTGENTIELRFETAVNVDYIEILAKPGTMREAPPVSIKYATKSVPQTGFKIWQSASGMVSLDLGYTPNAPVTLKIYDLKGKLISSKQVSTRFENVQLNVPNGVYLFKVGNRNLLYYSH